MFASTSAHAGASAGSVRADVVTCTNNATITGYVWSTVPWPDVDNKRFDFGGTFVTLTPNPAQPLDSWASGEYVFNSAPASLKILVGTGNQNIWAFQLQSYGINPDSQVDVSSLSSLTYLNMYGPNNISTVKGFEDKPMIAINWFNLTGLTGTSRVVPIAKLSNVTALQTLNVQNCNLTGTLPNNANYPALINYKIPYNKNLTSPASWSITAPVLSVLDISNTTGITSVPALPSSATSLTTIYAHNDTVGAGNIVSIPEITSFTNLQTITLGNNKLAGILPTMTGLTGLQVFSAPNNFYTGLPIGLWSGCKSIKTLDLNNNNLQKYINSNEYWFSGCANLNNVNFSGNKLSGYLPRFDFSSGINTIDFSNNSFDFIPTEYFTGFNSVNGITVATMNYGVSGLKVLNLSNNKLYNAATRFPPLVWRTLQPYTSGAANIEELYIANNKLTGNFILYGNATPYLSAAYYASKLKYLDISRNYLSYLGLDQNFIMANLNVYGNGTGVLHMENQLNGEGYGTTITGNGNYKVLTGRGWTIYNT